MIALYTATIPSLRRWWVWLQTATGPVHVGIYFASSADEARGYAWKIIGGRGPRFEQLHASPEGRR